MDAFEALATALAKQDAHVAIGVGDARAAEHRIVARFRKHVRNATIDALIRARAVWQLCLIAFDRHSRGFQQLLSWSSGRRHASPDGGRRALVRRSLLRAALRSDETTYQLTSLTRIPFPF